MHTAAATPLLTSTPARPARFGRRVIAALVCAVAALPIIGCAPKDDDRQESPAPPAPAEPASVAPAPPTALAKGLAFLAENGKRASVVTTASGLQYEVLASGTGATPTVNDFVTTHYHGTLIDGSVFDSSMERGEPIEFHVGGVIKGWTEALQLMRVGDKWKLYVPSELAYGKRGFAPRIGADETLIFEVELLDVRRS